MTTKNGYARSACSTKTSPLRTVRVRPCLATRAICTAVNVGKICSEREAVSGSGVFGSAILSCQTSTVTQAEPGDLPGLLAWHIILILVVAQPGGKRDPDASAGEPSAFGKIVDDDFSRVFV